MADFDINAILSSLSPEDMENLKKTAADIMGGMGVTADKGSNTTEKNTADNQRKSNEETSIESLLASFSGSSGNSFGFPDMKMLTGLAPVLQAVNSKDERVEFINALRPLLSDDRRKKADEAVRIVRLLSLLPLLKERGLM